MPPANMAVGSDGTIFALVKAYPSGNISFVTLDSASGNIAATLIASIPGVKQLFKGAVIMGDDELGKVHAVNASAAACVAPLPVWCDTVPPIVRIATASPCEK